MSKSGKRGQEGRETKVEPWNKQRENIFVKIPLLVHCGSYFLNK